jgi:hypothetical protein
LTALSLSALSCCFWDNYIITISNFLQKGFLFSMVWSSKQDTYLRLGRDDSDIENHSDTTLDSGELFAGLMKQSSRDTRKNRTQLPFTWFRWITITILQVAILIHLKQDGNQTCKKLWTAAKTETGGDINGLYVPSMSISERL